MAVVAGLVCALMTLIAWSLASPVGASPDDDYHMASIWCARGYAGNDCQRVEGSEAQRLVPLLTSGGGICYFGDTTVSAACQNELQDRGADTPTDRGNWYGSYPPLFYNALSIFVSDDVRVSVVLMRIANSVLTVLLIGALAWALPRRRRPLATLPLVLTSVPLSLFLLSSVNPSSWAILGSALTWPALYAAFETTGRRQLALCAITITGAGLSSGARADGTVFAVMAVVLVVLLRLRRVRDDLVPTATAVAAVAIAVAYFLGAGHSAVLNEGITDQLGSQWSTWQLILINAGGLPALWLGPFGYGPLGGTGWLDVTFPALVTTAGLAVWLLILSSAVRRIFPAKALGLTLSLGALALYPLYLLVQTGVVVGQGVQPRYLLPLLVIFTGLALLGHRGMALTLTKPQVLAATAALALAHTIALHVHMRRYVTGFDVAGVNLDRDLEWWWPSLPGPTVTWLLGSVSFAVLAYVVLRDSMEDRSHSLPGTRPPDGEVAELPRVQPASPAPRP